MSTINTKSLNFTKELLAELSQPDFSSKISQVENKETKSSSESFMDHLKDGLEEVNDFQKKADKMATDVSTGKGQNLHEAMLAATHAELSFNLMVQVRNKVLEAYQEVMRMPV